MAGIDPRQVLAAFLTASMFLMLGNMIKKDHWDPYFEVPVPDTSYADTSYVERTEVKIVEQDTAPPSENNGPWKDTIEQLKPCWRKPNPKDSAQTKGFVTLSLTTGPEYHISQISDAVVIARYLGATLVLPDIRGNELGKKRNFEDMYDVEKFMKSLEGVVTIAREIPAELADKKPALVRVVSKVSVDFIVKNVVPVFEKNSYLRIASSFPTTNMKVGQNDHTDTKSTACLAMYGSLELKSDIKEVAELLVERLRTLSRNQDKHFVAVDLRVDVLEKKSCKESGSSGSGRKGCYNAQEIADFLKKVGVGGDTVIYLTQTWWHENLKSLKEIFPKTYTKDDIMPMDKKDDFLKSGPELERALDLHICTESDVFVPAISGLFYGNVVGKRIAVGKTQVLVPAQAPDSGAKATDFLSTYISKKNHLAYSCYC